MNKTNKKFKTALEMIKNGRTIVFPTETTYGLTADATNHDAVARLVRIKGRRSKAVSVIVADVAMAQRYVKMSPVALRLAKWMWPGPLTMVLPAKCRGTLKGSSAGRLKPSATNCLSPYCIKEGMVAVRVSSHKVARLLSTELKKPIVATSANLPGKAECYSVRAVQKQFASRRLQPDYYLDVGVLPRRKPSTIIKISGNEIETLRAGSVTLNNQIK